MFSPILNHPRIVSWAPLRQTAPMRVLRYARFGSSPLRGRTPRLAVVRDTRQVKSNRITWNRAVCITKTGLIRLLDPISTNSRSIRSVCTRLLDSQACRDTVFTPSPHTPSCTLQISQRERHDYIWHAGTCSEKWKKWFPLCFNLKNLTWYIFFLCPSLRRSLPRVAGALNRRSYGKAIARDPRALESCSPKRAS